VSNSALLWGFLVLLLAVSVVVYVDARVNSSRSAFLWALAVLFGGPLGIVLYLLLGRDDVDQDPVPDAIRSERVVECPECHGLEETDRASCRFCGAELE
jgi:xanthine/uracil permease